MIRPPRLPERGTVGIVSPSSALSATGEAWLGRGVAELERLGLHVRLADHVTARRAYAAGTAAQRLADLHGMWADPGVHAVLMAQGGQSANHLLDGLDHRLLAANATAFVGMSDGTTLLSAITTRARVVTFHGAGVAWGFGSGMAEPVLQQFLDVLRGATGPLPTTSLRVLRDGRASGPLFGGHAELLAMTLLSGHARVPDGAVLLLEGTGTVDRFDRTLTALRLAGVLDRVSGVVLGHVRGHEMADPAQDRGPGDVLLEVLGARAVPVVEIGGLGHGVDNFTFPIGTRVTVDTADGVVSLDEPAVT